MRYLILPVVTLLTMLAGTGCMHQPQYHVVPDLPDTVTTLKNIPYGTDTTQQTMDVYLPAPRDAKQTPVVILIHGGSWVTGDKSDFNGLHLDSFFMSKGCAVISINYRLYATYPYVAPLEMEDMSLVMAYIKQQSAIWKINADRVCLLGKSAGSQLALQYAYTMNPQGRIKAVIDGFGPTNFDDSSIAPLAGNIALLLGGPYAQNRQLWRDASPVFYTASAVPTVIIQGTADQIVFPIQSAMLQDSLQAHNIANVYFAWQGSGHGWDDVKWNQCSGGTWDFVKRFL